MADDVHRTDQTGAWIEVGRDVSEISASSDGSIMVINKHDGTQRRKIGNDNTGAWTRQFTTQPAIAAAIPNAQRTIMVGKDTNLYRW